MQEIIHVEGTEIITGQLVRDDGGLVKHCTNQTPAAVYLDRFDNPGTRRNVRQSLDMLAGLLSDGRCDGDSMPWWLLRWADVAKLPALLAARYRPETANRHLVTFRGIVKTCRKMRLIDADAFEILSDIGNVRGHSEPKGRALEVDEVLALVNACRLQASPIRERDLALLALLFGAGLRRSEAAGLTLEDYDPATHSLRVLGKGRKERRVYLRNGAVDALGAWLVVRGSMPGALLWPARKGGHLLSQHMTDRAVYAILVKLAAKANVAHVAPHDARRSYASMLIDCGADLMAIKNLMGHESLDTTSRYDKRGEKSKMDAAGRLHFPYRATA